MTFSAMLGLHFGFCWPPVFNALVGGGAALRCVKQITTAAVFAEGEAGLPAGCMVYFGWCGFDFNL